MEDYRIPPGQVVTECEPEIRKKVRALKWWLYDDDDESEVRYRMAPSLIVRSEAELFGLSSPRFAVRAYFSDHSFVNIRRRNALHGMIDRSFDQQEIRPKLLDSLNNNPHVWIADSLLEPPLRLTKKGFEFITVNLGREYGEAASADVVPFVTHISIGGGLCAQASCFMAMCMAHSKPIFGISEITKMAASEPGPTKIHGLTAESITRFFVSSDVNLSAQLQTISNKKIEGDLRQFYLTAVESCVLNGIPIIAVVSLSRMQGIGFKKMDQKPVIRLNAYDQDESDYSRIPIGLTSKERKLNANTPDQDNHCVVVCGANSNEGFCVNDPATFPFLEASIDQLLDAGAYAKDGEIGDRISLDEGPDKVTIPTVGPPQFIAITPSGVAAPLLDFTESVRKVIPEAKNDSSFNLQGVLRTSVDVRQAYASSVGHQDLSLKIGSFFLVEHSKNGVKPKSRRSGFPNLDPELLNDLTQGWYWVESIDHPFGAEQLLPTLWFWNASDLSERENVALVLARQEPGDAGSWSRCSQFD